MKPTIDEIRAHWDESFSEQIARNECMVKDTRILGAC